MTNRNYLDLLGFVDPKELAYMGLPLRLDSGFQWFFADYSPCDYRLGQVFHYNDPPAYMCLVLCYLKYGKPFHGIPKGHNSLVCFLFNDSLAFFDSLPVLKQFDYNPHPVRIFANEI